jgi:cation transport regulator ChaC
MCIQKNHKSFTLYQKETKVGLVWYVRFWDETARRYAFTRSTGVFVEGKKQRRYEAEQAAREMLPGIQFAPAILKTFVQYLKEFWTPDSLYVREAAMVKNVLCPLITSV